MNSSGQKKKIKAGVGGEDVNTLSCDSYWTLDWQQMVRTPYGEGQSKPAREKSRDIPSHSHIHVY